MKFSQIKPVVDIEFKIIGNNTIPLDHGYHLFSALAVTLNIDLHNATWLGIHPIHGMYFGKNKLLINERSYVKVRVELDYISKILSLAGKRITINGSDIRLSTSFINTIKPFENLHARNVIINPCIEEEQIKIAIQKQFVNFGINENVKIILDKRRILSVHDKKIVGFGVSLAGLSNEESLVIQNVGLGGKRRFGCGIFVPTKIFVNK